MRVAMVSEHASPLAALGGVDAGGQNVHVAALATELGRRGHTVTVYTRRERPADDERVAMAPGVTVVHVPAGPARVLPKDDLLPLMDDFGVWLHEDWLGHGVPDVVHAHFWMSGLAALHAGRTARIPVVQTFHALGTVKRRHQGAADTSPPQRLELEAMLAGSVDLVVATCSDEVAELVRMGTPTGRVEVVPCGVDTAHFHPGDPAQRPGRRAASAPPGRPRLLLVGRMVPRKGFDTAIRALALLPGVELVIAGGPPADQLAGDEEVRRLRAVAAEVGVGDRVRMLGRVDHADMPEVYRSVEIVLSTPWYEPFGITPLEAAACGLPLVGSAVGGLLDSVADGHTGRLVPPRDPEALAHGIRELLDDPDTVRRWGADARSRALERFDWRIVGAATERALARVVGDHAAAPTASGATSTDVRVTVRDDVIGMARTAPARVDDPATAQAWLEEHADEVREGMAALLRRGDLIQFWGERLAAVLTAGGRLLVAGNGGSAAEAQHLTSELVGRFLRERRPLSAISLHAESSSLTAILNDYGPDEVFARQLEAHGRPGDVLMLLSTSGASGNVIQAAKRAHEVGVEVWAMTGPGPNLLAGLADSAFTVPARSTAAVQEIHLMAVHALCATLDARLDLLAGAPTGDAFA